MRRAVVIALSIVMGGLAAPADARPGKVVRVERPKHTSQKRIRLCVQYDTGGPGDTMLCIGAPGPRIGDEINLLDFNGPFLGTGRVRSTRKSTQAGCESDQVHEVEYYAPLSGREMRLGIIGVAMNDRSSVSQVHDATMPTRARDGENAWFGFNVDGVGDIDLLLTVRKCDLDRPSGYAGQGQCLSFWVRDSDLEDWRLHNEDAIYDCN